MRFKQRASVVISSLWRWPFEEIFIIGIEFNVFHDALGLNVDDKLRSNSDLTFNVDWSSHLLYDLLAYRKAQASALTIPFWVLVQLPEVDK